MRRMPDRPAPVLALLALLALAACGDDSGGGDDAPDARVSSYPSTTPHQSGVRLSDSLVTTSNSEECIECHEDIATAYASSGMHASLTLPTGAGSVEARMVGREVVDEETGITARLELADGHYVQRLLYRDPDDVERASYTMRMDLVIGSGHATRSYFAVDGPLLYQLPLTWYAQLDDIRLSPGPGFRTMAMRHAVHLCVSCHTGWVEPADNRSPLGFRGSVSMGIGCVRCHGSAEEHCDSGDPRDVANPSKMSAERQADVCEQCHRSGALNLVKRDQSFSAYTPGERLGKVYGVFEPAAGKEDLGTSIAGHGARMRLSRCFQESEGMTCTTCHNPHRGHKEAATARDTGSGCAICHQPDACHEDPAARAGQTCASCHMATVASNDIVHTRTTDHFVRRDPPQVTPRAGAHESQSLDAYAALNEDIVNVFDPDDELPGSRLLKARAYADGAFMAASFRGSPARGYMERARALLDTVLAETPEQPEARLQRARLLTLSRNEIAAVNELDALIATSPDWAEAVKLRALTTLSLGNAAESEKWLRRARTLEPHDESITLQLAFLLADSARGAEAMDLLDGIRTMSGPTLQRAQTGAELARGVGLPARGVPHAYDLLMFRPREPRALVSAADLCRDAGLPARQSRVLYEEALRRTPRLVAAMVGLGRLALRDGDESTARERLREASAIAPSDPLVRQFEEDVR